MRWLVHEQQKKLESKLSSNNLGHVGFRYSENGINWIRTSRLFITVIHKEQNNPDSLPDKLVEALNHWQPEPHRLLIAKMRAALDTRGTLAEEEVLDDPCLQAAWFEELLIEDVSQRKLNVNKTIERHWEGLGDSVQAEVAGFASKVTDYLCDLGSAKAYETHCPDGGSNSDRTKILAAANCYHCTKAIEGNHLTTGHVLKIGPEFWLCLSPACDLEPGQEKGWLKNLKPNMPFKAVQLHNADIKNALKNVNYGNHLFLQIDSTIKAFSFLPGDSAVSYPRWEQMFAARQGLFDDDKNINLRRVGAEQEQLVVLETSAQIVAHLRYEYALNLLQRLGVSLSRVGLDFQCLPNEV